MILQAAVDGHGIHGAFFKCVCVGGWGWKVGMEMKLDISAEIKQLLFTDIMSNHK